MSANEARKPVASFQFRKRGIERPDSLLSVIMPYYTINARRAAEGVASAPTRSRVNCRSLSTFQPLKKVSVVRREQIRVNQ